MTMLAKREGTIGEFEVARVLDSYIMGQTAQSWFPQFERKLIEPHLSWLTPLHYDPESGRIPMPVQSFILKTANHVILIDTCLGNCKERPGLPEMHRLSTRYLERLAAVGVAPHEVDFVMCSHLHVDHVGWNTRLDNGRWVPTFPKAKYLISAVEFNAAREEALQPNARPAIRNIFLDSIMPVVDSGQAELIEGIHEMLDSFTLRPAPGHSPGHIRIELRSRGEVGVFAGDLLHSPMQVPLWQLSSIVCWNQQLSAASRRELLEFCVESNAILIPGHFEAPHVARIKETRGLFLPAFGW